MIDKGTSDRVQGSACSRRTPWAFLAPHSPLQQQLPVVLYPEEGADAVLRPEQGGVRPIRVEGHRLKWLERIVRFLKRIQG